MIYFYSEFIEKLICAGRNDGTKPYFKFREEIDRDDFIRLANKFIENYYATVPPDFARKHPMKFSFGTLSQDGTLSLSRAITSRELDKYPQINYGLLYIEPEDGKNENGSTLDGSIFRQACFVRREEWKFRMTLIAVGVAVAIPLLLWFLRGPDRMNVSFQVESQMPKPILQPNDQRLTLRSSRTPPALPFALSQHFAISAPPIASAQAWPLSYFR